MFDFNEDYYAGYKRLKDARKYIGVLNLHGSEIKGPGIVFDPTVFVFNSYRFYEAYQNKKPHGMYLDYNSEKNFREVGFKHEGEYVGPCLSATGKEGYLTSFDSNSNENGFYIRILEDGNKFVIFQFEHGKINKKCLICENYKIYKGRCNSLTDYSTLDGTYITSSFLPHIPLCWFDASYKGLNLHSPDKIDYHNWYDSYDGGDVVRYRDKKFCYIHNSFDERINWAIFKTKKFQMFGEYSWSNNKIQGLCCERHANGVMLLGTVGSVSAVNLSVKSYTEFSLQSFLDGKMEFSQITISKDVVFIQQYDKGKKVKNTIAVYKDTFDVSVFDLEGKLIDHMPYEKVNSNVKRNEPSTTAASNNYIRENYPDGAWYEGELMNGKWHGQGTFCWPDGGKYVGQFANGVFHGEGILYHTNGTSNKVIYNNNEFVSMSANIIRENYPDGAWYEGELMNGKKHGQGTFCWPDGGKYVGQFANGVFHGEGILYHTNGTSNKVIYNNNEFVSMSANIIREDYPDGAWYEGELMNGKRHGQGTFCWSNGNKYVGGWNNGSMHGEGIIYYNNGVREKVMCDNGNYIHREII